MDLLLKVQQVFKIRRVGNIPLYAIVVAIVFVLAVLQDYIFSRLQQTGFYISESVLYNTFWIFFIPLTYLLHFSLAFVNFRSKWLIIPIYIIASLITTVIHLTSFTAVFVLVSQLVYSPSHRFFSIFDTVLSKQFYIALMWYFLISALSFQKKKLTIKRKIYKENIQLKSSIKTKIIPAISIHSISTDKPYSVLHTDVGKFLDARSLKDFEALLDPNLFFRIHRSAIINQAQVQELVSRKNGDYDAKLKNGEVVRLSRHYRNNWKDLLH